MINFLFNNILGGLWTVGKNAAMGAAGKSGGYVQGIKNHTKQMKTGVQYNRKGDPKRGQGVLPDDPTPDDIRRVAKEKPLTRQQKAWNRVKGFKGLASDLTLGTFGTALGWGARGAGIAAWHTGRVAGNVVGKPLLKGAGQTFEYATDSALHAMGTVVRMNNNAIGRGALTMLPLAGAAGYGMFREGSGHAAMDAGIQIAIGDGGQQYLHSIGGSVTAPARAPIPSTYGMDGDFVLAMHNLR